MEKRGAHVPCVSTSGELKSTLRSSVVRIRASLAREFSLSEDAIGRHARRHLSAAIAATAPIGPVGDQADVDVVAAVGDLQRRVMRLLRQAETKRDVRGALAAVREAAGLLTLLGRLQGIISADGTRIAIQVGTSAAATEAIRSRVLQKLAYLSAGRPPMTIEGKSE